nr:hypothetical protein [uncultured Mucilaginibacter sp.]
MPNYEFAIRYLQTIEKAHPDYFAANDIKILDCVEIKGTSLLSAHILRPEMPFAIRDEIETMFWINE